MAQTNFTPILLYGSSTPGNAPLAANLTNSATGSEIAINVADKNLFFKDSGGTVNTVPIRQSSTSSNGWLSSTDWNTFNGKQAALVSGTNIKTVGGVSLLGAGDVGTIGIAYGGTGQTSFTAGQIHYGSFSTSANLFYDSANVRLGVGTSSPTRTLDVNGAANINGALTINGNFTVPSGVTIFSSTGDVYARAGTSGNLYLGAGGSNSLLNLFASGGVSIGNTTDPGASNLSVQGNFLVGTTSNFSAEKICVLFNGATNNGLGLKDSADASGAFFQIFRNGSNTIIGSVTRVGTTNAVTFNTTSDQRLKSNIADANPVLNKLMTVKVRQFDWTVGNLHQDAGFIAQELAPILSGIVTEGKTPEDTWQLDYSRLTPYLLKALQELNDKFDAYVASHP